MVPTDAELVAKARNNKMYAFQQLIDRHKKKIYYTALGILGNHHDSEDILQEALLQALRSLDRLRNPDGFGPWIVRIAYNRSIDLFRKRKRELIPKDDADGKSFFERMENHSPAGNPDKMMESGEISKIIKHVLNTLPQSQRNAFMLKHIAQFSIKEIASTTESTESTVKTNIYRAVQKLRSVLAPYVSQGAEFPAIMNTGACEP